MDDKKEKKLKQAAALKYDASVDRAPYIIGLGQGEVAKNIIKKAQENDIPIVEDKKLSDALSQLGLGDDIPEELYQVIAEVLVFVTKLDSDHNGKIKKDKFGLFSAMKKFNS